MASDSQHAPQSESDTEQANRWAFRFFVGTLTLALLVGLWMMVQNAFF